jgi:hypothetical protein
MESLEIHRIKTDLILFHKIVTGEIHLSLNYPLFSDAFITRTNPRGLIPSSAYKNSRKDFFFVRVSKIYLKLPLDLVLLPPSIFSLRIKNMKLDYLLL